MLKNKIKALKNKKGFTLIELIVVIAVLGILVLLAAPRFLGYTADANVSAMKADAKVLENAALVWSVDQEANGEGSPGALPKGAAYTTYKIGEATLTEVYEIDDSELQIKNLKAKKGAADYVLVDKTQTISIGKAGETPETVTIEAGTVLAKEAVNDKDKDAHYGVAIEVEEGETVTVVSP